MRKKHCQRCSIEKPVSEFQQNGYGGLRPNCKSCLKADRVRKKVLLEHKKLVETQEVKKVIKVPEKIIVQPEVTEGLEELFERVRNKHQVFHTLSVEANGKSQLQVFLDKPLIFRGNSPLEVLQSAIA